MATKKALKDHEKSLARQRARRITPAQRDRNSIGRKLCDATIHSYQLHRQSKQATGST